MHDGIVEQMGAPLELYDRPANLFVAGFIGSPAMNFIKGKIRAGSPPSFLADSGAVYPLAAVPAGSDGKPATYGIRPENFQLSASGLPAEVVVVEPTGSETQVVAKISGQELVCVFRERVTAGPGETITIAPDPALVHLFDSETGKRLV